VFVFDHVATGTSDEARDSYLVGASLGSVSATSEVFSPPPVANTTY
jgi:hypothetical protein